MLRFLRSHITNSTEYKAEDLTDFFSYSKIATHGFPQKSSCIAVDERLGLLAIGTKDGRIRIVGDEGIEWSATIESGLPIAYIYFATGSGVLIALCDDPRTSTQSFHRCQIVNDRLSLTRFSQESGPKRITCCEMLNREDGNSALLIGTSTGSVYALWTQNLELVEYLIFTDASLKRLPELAEESARSIDKIVVHPKDSGKIFLLFKSKIVVLYDTLEDECEKVFKLSTPIMDMFCNSHGSKLFCAGVDGSYSVFRIKESQHEKDFRLYHSIKRIAFFGDSQCSVIKKIITTKYDVDDELVAFTGGLPQDLYGDRYTLTLHSNEKFLVLDFESQIRDFAFLNDEDGLGSALFILCEQELVAVDVQDRHWLPFSLPHFNPLHSSPVTATTVCSHLSPTAFARLCALAEKMEAERCARKVSARKWPLRCGSGFSSQNKVKEMNPHDITLLITGHENGCINIWLTNLLSLKPWIRCNSALEFDGLITSDSEEFVEARRHDSLDPDDLPLRKAGLFDSFCDDHRLTVLKVAFDVDTAHLVAGGRAGQVLVYEASNVEELLGPIQSIVVDMAESEEAVSSPGNPGPSTSVSTSKLFVRSKETVLPPRRGTRRRSANYGFVPSFDTLLQFSPVTQVSAVAYNASRAILAAGNEFGYALCSLRSGECLVKSCLLSSQEVVHISNLDGTLSRFKSVKKSIRQSFRRKKRQVNAGGESTDERTLSILEECRPAEREIAQRVANPSGLGGETPHSLIKVLQIAHCRLGANLALADYLFVGTFGGAVLIHQLLDDAHYYCAGDGPMAAEVDGDGAVGGRIIGEDWGSERDREQSTLINNSVGGGGGKWDAKCPLVKEIRLRHRAPIINIECVQDLLASRLLIFTEEQIRAFMLPTLKPSRFKCRFTAVEGSRIRKASTILMKNSKSKRVKSLERFIGLITNRGEVYVLSLQNPRRTIHVPFTRASDAAGISSAVLSTEGELFYLRTGGSELQRASIAASPNYSAPTPFRDEQFLPPMI